MIEMNWLTMLLQPMTRISKRLLDQKLSITPPALLMITAEFTVVTLAMRKSESKEKVLHICQSTYRERDVSRCT